MTDSTTAQSPAAAYAEAHEQARASYLSMVDLERARVRYLLAVLDQAHHALRGIDAADQTSPIPDRELCRVSEAVAAVETAARGVGFVLSEFRPATKPGAALSRAMGGGDDLLQTLAGIVRPGLPR